MERVFLEILSLVSKIYARSSGSAEEGDEGMALKIRVERFHLFRFRLTLFLFTLQSSLPSAEIEMLKQTARKLILQELFFIIWAL